MKQQSNVESETARRTNRAANDKDNVNPNYPHYSTSPEEAQTATAPGDEAPTVVMVETVTFADGEPELLTDMGNAARFARENRDAAAFNEAYGWLLWDGTRWARDDAGRVMEAAKDTARAMYHEAAREYGKAASMMQTAAETGALEDHEADLKKALDRAKSIKRWAKQTQSGTRLREMIKLGATEAGIYTPPEWFDAEPGRLNVSNGTLDLRTGRLRDHDPRDYLTKIVNIAYDPQATCPTWHRFLNDIMKGNQAMIDFLQRAIGYSLSGSTKEQCLFFLHGFGANGKSTFTGILQALLGDYAERVPTQTLLASRYDGIPNDIAKLAGARLAVASELPAGRYFDEELVKDLTGATGEHDKLTARFLRQEYFDFRPQFKLWIYGNHKPKVKGTDDGIWRRFHLVEFKARFEGDNCDPDIPEKLDAELPGILAWAVQGYQKYLRQGLDIPQAVTDATAQYRSSQDVIGTWIDERTVTGSVNYVTKLKELYEDYKEWAALANEKVENYRTFTDALTERGYPSEAGSGNVTVKRGIALVYRES